MNKELKALAGCLVAIEGLALVAIALSSWYLAPGFAPDFPEETMEKVSSAERVLLALPFAAAAFLCLCAMVTIIKWTMLSKGGWRFLSALIWILMAMLNTAVLYETVTYAAEDSLFFASIQATVALATMLLAGWHLVSLVPGYEL